MSVRVDRWAATLGLSDVMGTIHGSRINHDLVLNVSNVQIERDLLTQQIHIYARHTWNTPTDHFITVPLYVVSV